MKEFIEVTDEHLKLLKAAYVSWDDCEFGSPEIDCKRPFGNSNVYGDMLEELEIPYEGDADEYVYSHLTLKNKLDELYSDLQICLQILLNDLHIETGIYKHIGYGKEWKRINDNNRME